jgi:diaminopropionate ammonia-lyase
MGDAAPSHIMLPAGCGGMAAAMIAAFDQLLGEQAPKPIIVEPITADCVFASALEGTPTVVGGDLDTIMGGLSCAAVSYVAWPTLAVGA